MKMKPIMESFRRYEEGEEIQIPPEMKKNLDSPLPSPQDSPERNLEQASRIIDSEGYVYKIIQKNNIRVLDDDRIETMQKLEQMLSPMGFVFNPSVSGSSIGRLELVDPKAGSVYLYVKPVKGTPASIGADFENKIANEINQRYSSAGFEAKTAGSSPGSDLLIKKDGVPVMSVELKTSLSSDFGQFRVQYNLGSGMWECRRTKGFNKNEQIFEPLFDDYLRDWLNSNARFPDTSDKRFKIDKNKIAGISLSTTTGSLKRELQRSWFNGKTDYKVPFDFSRISSYYSDKGDSFIQINGVGLYALKPEARAIVDVPLFSELGLGCFMRFRLKPSSGENSGTSFTVAVKLKGRYQRSNLSLTNQTDLDAIMSKLSEDKINQ